MKRGTGVGLIPGATTALGHGPFRRCEEWRTTSCREGRSQSCSDASLLFSRAPVGMLCVVLLFVPYQEVISAELLL